MWGAIYRIGVHVKEEGEMLNCGWMIRIGFFLREVALRGKTA
jgi:hypothetical protein